jgi:hypothetical protein
MLPPRVILCAVRKLALVSAAIGWMHLTACSSPSKGGDDSGTTLPPCPMSAPANDELCREPDNRVCSFGSPVTTTCLCGLVAPNEQRWNCRAVNPECPPTAPSTAASCKAPSLTTCFYPDSRFYELHLLQWGMGL